MALLPSNGARRTTTELAAALYGKQIPLSAGNIIVARMRSIMRKQAVLKTSPKVHKSDPRGPYPIEFWLA